jgi:uncharacterized membrane protein
MRVLKEILRWLMALLYVAAGLNHFLRPAFYAVMIPPYLPAPQLLVTVSGLAEIALGILVVVPRVSRLAAWGVIALLIAVFPANLYMAQHPEHFPQFSRSALLIRLPIQLVLILWAYWYTIRRGLELHSQQQLRKL